ncbi:hypothetical protein KY5_4241 [Streptomyces formicae]|uniref:Uncharacterized protein n=2 Tax=Streptomyces TaxID=1883 RepID=A0A291QC22_9ACTN|nr:hypothetical protein KY5_4241 [Streptomyces formicae]
MFKRMLRSVLVTTFSAGLVMGAVSALDLSWSVQQESAATSSVAAPPPDLSWSSLPKGAAS